MESFDDRTERFLKETGIWPPGRDRPSAMAIDPHYEVEEIRMAFYAYWCTHSVPLTEHPDVQRLIMKVQELQMRLEDNNEPF